MLTIFSCFKCLPTNANHISIPLKFSHHAHYRSKRASSSTTVICHAVCSFSQRHTYASIHCFNANFLLLQISVLILKNFSLTLPAQCIPTRNLLCVWPESPMQILKAYKYIWLWLYEIITDELHCSSSLPSRIAITASEVYNAA